MNEGIVKGALCMGILSFGVLSSCAEKQDTADEKKEEVVWDNLLEGNVFDKLKPLAGKNGKERAKIGSRWVLADGELSLDFNREGRGGHLVTKKHYFNFEFKFEYKIGPNSNSGIKYRTDGAVGLEYQMIDDDDYKDNKKPSHRTGGLYDLAAVPADRKLNPAGEWNTARIVANGNVIEHWLNGEKVIDIEYGSEDWEKRFMKSKYKKDTDFASTAGAIMLQDHTDTIITFKNLMVREIK